MICFVDEVLKLQEFRAHDLESFKNNLARVESTSAFDSKYELVFSLFYRNKLLVFISLALIFFDWVSANINLTFLAKSFQKLFTFETFSHLWNCNIADAFSRIALAI
jgi:hypothetical protein